MVENITICKDCIKEDVCGIKKSYAYALEQIKDTNTSLDDVTHFLAKDNTKLAVSVRCKSFAVNMAVRSV